MSETDENTLLKKENQMLRSEKEYLEQAIDNLEELFTKSMTENIELKRYIKVLEKKVVDVIEKLKWLDAETKTKWLEEVRGDDDETEEENNPNAKSDVERET